MFLVRRMFSLTTGAMQEETIVHRAKPLDDVDYPSGQYSIATSPDSSYSIVGIMTGVKGTSRKLEVVLLGKDLSVIATRSVTFTPARKGDVFRSMLIDNQGDLFITSVDPKATLTVTKQSMLDGPGESRLSATIPAPADEIPDTLGTYARVEDNNTIRIIRAYSIHNRLVGISVTKFDFGRDYVPVNTFTAVQDSTIRQIFGDVSTFEYAAFHSCLTTSTDTAFTLLFEQRIGISRTSWLGKFPNLDNGCRAGNVLMLGIDGVGALRWRQGFRKDQASRYASFAGISFETRATSHNTVQYFYRSGMKIVVREYRATDGESVDGGKEHEVLILPSLVLLRGAYPMLSTSTWLNDRSFVFSTFMHEEVGFHDMKLVKVDY